MTVVGPTVVVVVTVSVVVVIVGGGHDGGAGDHVKVGSVVDVTLVVVFVVANPIVVRVRLLMTTTDDWVVLKLSPSAVVVGTTAEEFPRTPDPPIEPLLALMSTAAARTSLLKTS